MKVLRPEQCVVDGKLCAACTEDIEFEQEINKIEKQIKELESRLKRVRIKRRALRTAMNENHDSLIHQFPPEIVSHIFIQYSPPAVCFDKFNENPLYLGAVCQKWRQLAWAMPGLWTSLHVRCPQTGEYDDNLPRLVNEWLKRSASLPFTIRVDDYWGWADVNDEALHILATHSARWRDVHFDLSARHLHRLSGSSQGNILRRLALCHSYYGTCHFSIFSMKSKPSPTDLTLQTVGLQYVDIAWNNPTVASVYNIGIDECFELIRRAPLLETLRLQSINLSSSVFAIPSTRMICPHLHLLELSKIKEGRLAQILDSLCLPSLKQWIHDQSPFLLDNMMSFVGCLSSTCLKIFKISIDMVDYQQVARFLSHLSSLEFLELRSIHCSPTDGLFSLLCASTKSPAFLPHLQSLEFLCNFGFPWDFLPQIFSLSCWKALRVKVNIRVGDLYSDEENAKLLLELVDKGLDLSIIQRGKFDLLQEYREGSASSDE